MTHSVVCHVQSLHLRACLYRCGRDDRARHFDAARAQGAIYAWTNDSFWNVGRLDKELSALCRRNAFNQIQKNRLKIWYTGKDNIGRGTTGVAKYGWNLHDPNGVALPDVTYHFINDGYSDCTVFVAP